MSKVGDGSRVHHGRYARRLYHAGRSSPHSTRIHTCPACGREFDLDGNNAAFPDHLRSHRPQDFGLTPLSHE